MSNDSVSNGCHAGPEMQLVDKFILAVAIFWSFSTLYSIALFLPPLTRQIRAWELRRKPSSRTPTYPQRILLLLMTLLMEAVLLSAAFHRDLLATIGLSSRMAWWLMIILPVLFLVLGARNKPRNQGKDPDATGG